MKAAGYCLAALMSMALGNAQVAAPAKEGVVFGGMKLLPGYSCSPPTVIDGAWTISKKDGVTIRYWGGNVANVVHSVVKDARRDGTALWTKEQLLSGRKAELAMTKDGRLLISIEPFNFDAKVDSVEQATDALLMVLTYGESDDKR